MAHVGIIAPNAAEHLNPMTALAHTLRTRGHRVSFFLLGDPPSSVGATGFEVVQLGGALFPANEYTAGMQQLGVLTGRAALKHTMVMLARATQAILEVGPARVRQDTAYRAAAERVCQSINAAGGAPRAAEIIENSLALES